MARRSLSDEADVTTRIDLAPMIDCVFLLLIFFLVTTVFVEEPGVSVLRPDAVLDQDLEKNSILIAITADDEVVYGGKAVGVAGVGARVKQLLNREDLPIIIQADARSDHGVFSEVWTEVKHAGGKKISIATRNER